MKTPFHLLTVLFFCFFSSLSAQNKVTGKVTDADNGAPLISASVKLKGTRQGTTTNSHGEFSISAPSSGVLILSNVGYVTQEIPINGKSVIDVALKTNNSNLNEVVVVGYKSVIKRDVSGAVSSIDMKDLKDIPAASLLSLLSGKAPGVQAVTRTGLPGGSGGGLVIRGNTSLSDASDVNGLSNPLYIVDGVPISLTDLAGFDVTQNDFFATLNPNDIESIDILKDAAATAIYGSRGANGVVIIKTKKGHEGKPISTSVRCRESISNRKNLRCTSGKQKGKKN